MAALAPALVTRLILAAALICLAPLGAEGDDGGPVHFDFAGDTYAAGAAPNLAAGDTGSLFVMGETVRSMLVTQGSAHLVGRRVAVRAAVARDVYAVGYEIDVEGPVGGDANLLARVVRVEAPVGGVVRAFGATVVIDAPVGALLVTARNVRLDAAVAGDARITADSVEFGPDARVDGRLILQERGPVRVPPGVAEDERVVVLEGAPRERRGIAVMVFGAVASVLAGAAAVLVALALLLGLAPRWSEDVAFDVAERPGRSFGAGFLTLAAVFGAIPLLFATLIGIPLVFVVLALIPFALLAGHALGVWALGAAVWRAMDRPAPLSFWSRMGIAVVGLIVAALLALIPIVGWLVTLSLTLVGLGAATARLLATRRA